MAGVIKNCCNCKHDGEKAYCKDCFMQPVANTFVPDKWENNGSLREGDRIRAMNNEELAEYLSETFCHGYGKPQLLDWLNKTLEG